MRRLLEPTWTETFQDIQKQNRAGTSQPIVTPLVNGDWFLKQ
jgi:hypothetical protein